MSIQVGFSRKAGVLIASPAGRVDSANSREFREALEAGIPSEERALLLDLGQLTYMSSAGLRVLLMAARRFQGPDNAIGVCSLSPMLQSIISLSGFDKIMPVYETVEDALRSISGEEDAGAVSAGIPESRSQEELMGQLPSSLDMNTLGDNITDIAEFTIEKHEFTHDRLDPDVREQALSAIKGKLWGFVEEQMKRRHELLTRMFASAEATFDEVMKGNAR